jgi:nitrite reductase (NAD(P)H)
MAVKIVDRFLIYYIRSADKLQRTARWMETLPKGLQSLKEVIIEDKLGICAELEKEMDDLVGTFHCEWTEVLKDPERKKAFRQFVNTSDNQTSVEKVEERHQTRPADWPEDSGPLKFSRKDIMATAKWEWKEMCNYAELDPHEQAPTSAVVKYGDTQIAIWNIPGKGLRASQNMCPHKRAFGE